MKLFLREVVTIEGMRNVWKTALSLHPIRQYTAWPQGVMGASMSLKERKMMKAV